MLLIALRVIYYALALFGLTSRQPPALFPSVSGEDILQYVDPLIGTANDGHVFGGANMPYGMAKAVPDVEGNNRGGFASDDSEISGFSHMHDSGTGGASGLGNFPIFAYNGCKNDNVTHCELSRRLRSVPRVQGSVKASPGYFSIELKSGIKAEMTTSEHVALYRFHFSIPTNASKTPFSPLIVQDITNLLYFDSGTVAGDIQIDKKTGRITGGGTYPASFGVGTYQTYFCTDFDGAPLRDVGITDDKEAWARFGSPTKNNQILVRVGVSFMNTDKACQNAESEIPNFDFANVQAISEDAWRQKLGVISIEAGGTDEMYKTLFWSGIYRGMISPQDYTGENPLWVSSEPYWDSFYCIWDSFRITDPLRTIIDPKAHADMLRSLLDTYRHEGYLPDCRMSLCQGLTQGGSNADVVMAEAYLKGFNAPGLDWAEVYEAVVKDAEVQPENWGEVGRGYLRDYHSLGYIPVDATTFGDGKQYERSISRTVEYAYNDFCIAQMSKSMGKTDDYDKYSNRSSNWKNVYRVDQADVDDNGKVMSPFVGFVQPRMQDGSWGMVMPTWGSPINSLNAPDMETYEGSAWLYTFYAPGDMASLIKAVGGKEEFVKRLDYFHDGGIVWTGDEQAYLPTFQYHYGGRPGRTSYRSHFYIPREYNTTLGGIPGNDDSGAMGAFSTFAMLGFFPIGGQNVYLIVPPYFEAVSITNPITGKTATVRNLNFDPTYKAIYIQSATLNGKTWTKNWLDHSFFTDGGTLELTLGTKEGSWGTRDEDLPPSLSTTGMYIPKGLRN